ncbi:MAG: hypothetical protein E7005_03710 [Alphaproteobacteria bacterium]|nr:hypothetical protein [Alphaproteobacteria bacterium]
MENNSTPALESYEIIENENNEIMILIYAGPTEPANSTYTINEYAKHIILKRNSKDTLYIEQLSDEHMQKIKKLNTIYVCELKYNENLKEDEETDIVYAYASTKEIPVQNKKQETNNTPKKDANKETTNEEPKQENILEKAKKTREKLLAKKNNK